MTRFFCHCTICQTVYGRPFSDVTVSWAKHALIEIPNEVEFKRSRPPPNLNRGLRKACKMPVVGQMTLLPALRLSFVPTHVYQNPEDAPEARMHIFYDKRQGDVTDELPKYSGYVRSELAVSRLILAGMFGRQARC